MRLGTFRMVWPQTKVPTSEHPRSPRLLECQGCCFVLQIASAIIFQNHTTLSVLLRPLLSVRGDSGFRDVNYPANATADTGEEVTLGGYQQSPGGDSSKVHGFPQSQCEDTLYYPPFPRPQGGMERYGLCH